MNGYIKILFSLFFVCISFLYSNICNANVIYSPYERNGVELSNGAIRINGLFDNLESKNITIVSVVLDVDIKDLNNNEIHKEIQKFNYINVSIPAKKSREHSFYIYRKNLPERFGTNTTVKATVQYYIDEE